jgi:hypothetical protein
VLGSDEFFGFEVMGGRCSPISRLRREFMRGLNCGRIIVTTVVLFVIATGTGWKAEMQRPVISRIPPNYPEIARRMHVEGSVVVELTAMPGGSVSRVHAILGHTLLMQAAEDCVALALHDDAETGEWHGDGCVFVE